MKIVKYYISSLILCNRQNHGNILTGWDVKNKKKQNVEIYQQKIKAKIL